MSLRRRLSFSRNRLMEKSNGGTCRHHVWFVIFGSLLLWFVLFYFNSVAYETSMNKVQSIINSVMSPPEPISVLGNDNRTRISPSFQMENKKENEPVDQIHVVEEKAKTLDEQVSRENKDVPVIELPVKENRTDDKMVTSKNQDEPVSVVVLENREVPVVTKLENRSHRNEPVKKGTDVEERKAKPVVLDPCSGRYVYVHDLPTRFNTDMIKECRTLNLWADMCPFVFNSGLGHRIGNSQGAFMGRGWFTTDQFTLDVIFHNRMKQYKCLTNNSTMASAIFVPFYAGLDITRYLWGYNTSIRDAASLDLFKLLTSKPEWKVLGGRDHFLVAGRISWDFRRLTNVDADWGNNLMILPEAKNMSLLVLEKSPWHRNDFAIPYPTYFHPLSDIEVSQWQNRMRRLKKKCLFSFVGAPRPNMTDSIRGQIIHQCQASKNCRLLDCGKGAKLCYKPSSVMKLFQSSIFCLQPPGDSYTRKSAFDSILAGCIPVFFHPGSAYIQYIWHLPKDYTKYSVLMSENDVRKGKVNIDSVLSRIPKEKVIAMREEVIRLIPKVIYTDPNSRLKTFEDAFDIAVKGVIERVNKVRMEMREGKDSTETYKEENTWKYNLFGTEEKHEWDDLFRKPEK